MRRISCAHLEPQLGVEVGERLVHQDERRLDDDGARDGDALLLAAGQLPRQLVAPGSARRTSRSASSTRRSASARGTPRIRRPKPTFLRTLICGKSA